MTLSLDAMIARTRTAMKTEKDPDKLAALAGDLAAYKKTKTHIEKHETEEGADDEDEDEGSSEESKGDETERKSDDPDDEGDDSDDSDTSDKKDDDSDDSDSDDEDDDEEDDEEESESEEANYDHEEEEAAKGAASQIVRASGLTQRSSRRALRRAAEALVLRSIRTSASHKVMRAAMKITGKKSAVAIIASLQGNAEGAKELRTRVAAIENERRQERKALLIREARAAKRISKREADTLAHKKLGFVQSYLEMRPAAIVSSDPSQLHQPADAKVRGNAATTPVIKDGKPVSPEMKRELDRAAAAAKAHGLKGEKADAFMRDLVGQLSAAGARVTMPEN